MKLLVIFLIISTALVLAQSVFAEENLCISQPSQFPPLKLQYSFDETGTVKNICISAFRSILVYVNGTNDSSITVNIPKNIRCFIGLYNAQYGDEDPIVLINGGEVDFAQSMRKNSSQDITINVKDGRNEIEIIGGSLINPTESCLSPKLQQHVGISADQIMCKSGMFKMKKISTDSVLCIKYRSSQKLVERGFATFVEDVTTSEMLCKSYGGKWLEQYKECETVSEQACKSMNGSYDECGSMCRHYPKQDEPVACLMGCAQLCFLK